MLGSAVAACGYLPGDQTGVASTEDVEVVLIPGEGQLSPDLIVSCHAGPSFPLAALDRIVPLSEGDPGGVTEAIALFLESAEGQYWPQDDWQILHTTQNEILLVHKGDGGGLAFMNVSNGGDGWKWSGSQSGGPCPLEYTVARGMNAVDWRLDPSASAPTPESIEIAVLITERECVSGQEIGDRLVGPQIVMTELVVRIAFAAEPPGGTAFDCQGNPETPLLVVLPEPIGERELVEGAGIGIDLEAYLD